MALEVQGVHFQVLLRFDKGGEDDSAPPPVSIKAVNSVPVPVSVWSFTGMF